MNYKDVKKGDVVVVRYIDHLKMTQIGKEQLDDIVEDPMPHLMVFGEVYAMTDDYLFVLTDRPAEPDPIDWNGYGLHAIVWECIRDLDVLVSSKWKESQKRKQNYKKMKTSVKKHLEGATYEDKPEETNVQSTDDAQAM